MDVMGVRGDPLGGPFPDHEQLLLAGTSRSTTVASRALEDAVAAPDDVVAVRVDRDRWEVAVPGPADEVGLSRSFLLDAVRAARAEHLALSLEDGRCALRVSPADRPQDLGLVMPIRL